MPYGQMAYLYMVFYAPWHGRRTAARDGQILAPLQGEGYKTRRQTEFTKVTENSKRRKVWKTRRLEITHLGV